MITEIPLFPLHTVLFPETPVYLHIFEPRYKIMLRRCLAKEEPFGVVLIQQGQEAFGPVSKVYNVGCTAHIVQVEPSSTISYNLTALGKQRFRVLELKKDRPYMIGTVETYDIEAAFANPIHQKINNLNRLIKDYLERMPKLDLGTENMAELSLPGNPISLVHMAASLLQLPGYEKQHLLEAQSITELAIAVDRLYRREISVIDQLLEITDMDARRAAWLN